MSFKLREEHWEVMISFFEENKELAMGRLTGLNGREKSKKLWNELTLKLNSLGFGERTAEKWQKTWTDLKYLLKKKGANVKKDQACTGGGPSQEIPFNQFELRLLAILGDSFYQGVGEPEIAQSTPGPSSGHMEKVPFRVQVQRTSEENISKHKDHNYTYLPAPKRRKAGLIEDSYKETVTILKDIKEVIDRRLGEISGGIQDIKNAIKDTPRDRNI